MNFKPILFSTDMVKAILEGRKTQTRRSNGLDLYSDASAEARWSLEGVSNDPLLIVGAFMNGDPRIRQVKGCYAHFHWSGRGAIWKAAKCPYGQVGDVLWVRETFRTVRGNVTGIEHDFPSEILYAADGDRGPHKPSIHMPKEACRIFLEITDIRVERLGDISEEDAKAEGVKRNGETEANNEWFHYMRGFDDFPAFSAKESFFSLWEKINGAESRNTNPWIWVVTFRPIDKPSTFPA